MPTPPQPLTSEEIARFQTEQGARHVSSRPPATTHSVLFSMEVQAGVLASLLKSPVGLASIPDIEKKLRESVLVPPADIKSEGLLYTLADQGNGKTLVTYYYRSAWPPDSPLK